MTPKTKIAAAGLVALSMLGLATTAARADSHGGGTDDAAEAQAFAGATVSLAQAVTAAEAQGGGQVLSIDFDNGDDGEPTAWDVEVLMPDGTTMDLVVNAADGTVTPDSETDDDNGQGEDGESGEEGEEGGEENEG